ncbi:MAG: ATP-binding protein [Acidimicrobiia bacterium]|nr:ATP-binding protein [Acidimicrobiia bacterium]
MDDTTQDLQLDAFSRPPTVSERWVATTLDVDVRRCLDDDWMADRAVLTSLPAYERTSVLRAIEHLPGRLGAAAFAHGERSFVRRVKVPTGPGLSEDCVAPGTLVGWRYAGVPVITWMDVAPDDPIGELQLACLAAEVDVAHEALATLRSMVVGDCSTWRRRHVVFDPTSPGLLRFAAARRKNPRPGSDGRPASTVAPELAAELTRHVVTPVRRWEEVGDLVPRRGVLLFGSPGSGKRHVVRWLLGELVGVTCVTATPRVLMSGDLVRTLYDMAAAVVPSLVVLEDLDLTVGDWSSSPAPDGLVELVTQLDGPSAARGVVTVATTNDPGAAETTFVRRTDRFDRLVHVGPPSDERRAEWLTELVARHSPGDAELAERLEHRTRGWTFGQLYELERTAVLSALADGRPVDLAEAVEQVRSQAALRSSAAEGAEGSYL